MGIKYPESQDRDGGNIVRQELPRLLEVQIKDIKPKTVNSKRAFWNQEKACRAEGIVGRHHPFISNRRASR